MLPLLPAVLEYAFSSDLTQTLAYLSCFYQVFFFHSNRKKLTYELRLAPGNVSLTGAPSAQQIPNSMQF